jgi:hypothetical protein
VQKGWRVQNNGTCIWDTSYTLQFDSPNNPTWINLSPSQRLERKVQPGEMLDVWVTARAPLTPGAQQGNWKLVDGRGQMVGQPLVMEVETALLATGTASGRAWFTAYPPAVEPGGQVALAWSVQDAKAVYLSTARQDWQANPVEATASRFVYPQHPTTYELHIVNSDDSVETIQLRVGIEEFELPRIRAFRVEPRYPFPGECVTIAWEVVNRVHTVFIFLNDDILYFGSDDVGTLHTCPEPGLGAVTYWIKAEGPGGDATAERPVDVP